MRISITTTATPLTAEQKAAESERQDAIRHGLKDQRGAPLAPRGQLRCSHCDDIADEKKIIEVETKTKGDISFSLGISYYFLSF